MPHSGDDQRPKPRATGGFTLIEWLMVLVMVGILVAISTSVVFFYVEDDLSRLVVVTFGLAILFSSSWVAANPFISNKRDFLPLRREVDGFIDLVRLLNTQVLEEAAPEDVARTTAEMHESVERMVEEAAKTS